MDLHKNVGKEYQVLLWSSFESIVLHEVLSTLQQNTVDAKDITKLFNDIVHYSTSSYCLISSNVVFRGKSINEITAKLNFTNLRTIT